MSRPAATPPGAAPLPARRTAVHWRLPVLHFAPSFVAYVLGTNASAAAALRMPERPLTGERAA